MNKHKKLVLLVALCAGLGFAAIWSGQLLWSVLFAVSLWFTLSELLRIGREALKRSSRIKPAVKRTLAALAGAVEVVALVFGVFYFVQDYALFHPGHDQASWQSLTARSEFDAVEFTSEGKTWHGILRKNTSTEPSPLILLFCGNGQNASRAMSDMDRFGIWPYFRDYQCLVVDYAGYGLNDSQPSAGNMCAEALAAFDYASALPEVSQVIVGGYSIGTGPAVYLAAHREISGLFLLAPFANSYDLYNNVLPVFYGPLRLFVKHRFPSDQYARTMKVPVLVVASKDDEMVPFASSERLNECFAGVNTFVTLSGVGHNSIFFNRTALDSVKVYLDEVALLTNNSTEGVMP